VWVTADPKRNDVERTEALLTSRDSRRVTHLSKSGSLAIFAAIRRASSFVSSLACGKKEGPNTPIPWVEALSFRVMTTARRERPSHTHLTCGLFFAM
jgi:hypothetical protein